jgi:hypothetical protein
VLRWPVTLLKLQVSALYFFTAIGKMNPYFLSGEVLGKAFRIPEAFEIPLLLQAMSAATIVLELFLAFALWSRRWQRAAFVAGLMFHTLVLVLIGFYGGLVVFGVTILAPYVLFLSYEPGSRLIVYGETDTFSRGVARWTERLDWLGAFRFRAAPAVSGGLELDQGPTVRHGLDAVREILSVLPLSFLWAPLLALPGVRALYESACRTKQSRARQQAVTR